jgi:Leucine-rich repeat (LRR) protein
LSGDIPPELGNLAKLKALGLGYNQLSGEVPPELGKLVKLEGFGLDNNQLSGPLPESLTNLTALLYFSFNKTNLCEPEDPAFRTWLDNIMTSKSTGVTCSSTQNQ